jgi:transcriptional regulator with XRE-family HTH domain
MIGDRAPFDVALRRAVAARGLTLDRLAERLAASGTPVSVSTLSNWQRGRTIPATPASHRAVVQLERILGLTTGVLTDVLDPYRGGDRRLPTRAGLSQPAALRLRAEFGLADPGLTTVRLDDDVRLAPGRMEVETRITVRAERSGVDRFVAMEHPDAGSEPWIRVGPSCRLGDVRRDEAAGLYAVELVFDAPLTRGELYPVMYRSTTTWESGGDGYHGTWLKPGLSYYGVNVEFDPKVRPSQVYRVWRTSADVPHKRVADLRLIYGQLAHLWLTDPPAGFHGIRWEP